MSDESRSEDAAMPYHPGADEPPASRAAAVKRRHEVELLELEGVEGVGLGSRAGREVIVAYIRSAEVETRLPREIDGVPVAAQVSGEIEAL